jgi:hypothetical protein
MRKPAVAAVAARKVPALAAGPDTAPATLVCLALALALLFLAARIASIW